MKRLQQIFVFLIIWNGYSSIMAQPTNLKDYHIWIQPISNFHPIHSVKFQSLTDSSIIYIKKNTVYQTPLKNIANLYIRKKGKATKAALKGAGIGLISGLAIALIDGEPPENCFLCISRQDKLKIYGLNGAVLGISIGSLFGNRRKKILINPKKKPIF